MTIDILTKQPITTPTVEHILIASLKGKLRSSEMIDETTNNLLGSTIDKALSESLMVFSNALGLSSRRGKTSGFDIRLKEGEYDLASGFRPVLKKPVVKEYEENGTKRVTIQVRSVEEAERIVSGLKKKCGAEFDPGQEVTVVRQFVREPVPLNLEFGGPISLRCVAKMCFEFAAFSLSPESILAPRFDRVRDWILAGGTDFERLNSADYTEAAWMCNQDMRPDLWAGLPTLNDAPFQNRIFVFGSSRLGGCWACFEIFGHIRFSCALADDWDGPDVGVGYLCDPISGNDHLCRDLKHTYCVSDIYAHKIDLKAAESELSGLMSSIQELHRKQFVHKVIDDCIGDVMPPEGEIIQHEHMDRLVEKVASRLADFVEGSSSSEQLSFAALKAREERRRKS